MSSRPPVDVRWRVKVVLRAAGFFAMLDRGDIAEMIGKPVDPPSGPGPLIPWTVSDFLSYLQKVENELEPWPRSADVQRVLSDLERAGFLQNSGLDLSGPAMFNTTYWWRGGITKAQQGGLLGLSEVVGHGLIIESYKAVTAPIARPGVAGIGSGLVIGPWHILTNEHVITNMKIEAGDELETPKTPRPPVVITPWHEIPDTVRVARAVTHKELDVGVIELEGAKDQSGLNVLDGVVFRNPTWTDRAYVFGYPPVPTMMDAYVSVHDGEVINPRVLTIHSGDVVNPDVISQQRQRFFLYSSTTRGGNSGGPIVAQDGRVIGLVAHATLDKGKDEPPFYRGVPGADVANAVSEMGFDGLITLEDWATR